jgi:hypothetical protein
MAVFRTVDGLLHVHRYTTDAAAPAKRGQIGLDRNLRALYKWRIKEAAMGARMINLSELRSEDLEKILRLRRKVETVERRIAAILKRAGMAGESREAKASHRVVARPSPAVSKTARST